MNPAVITDCQRLLDRWDFGDDHAGVTRLMLDRAVDRGCISPEQRAERSQSDV